MTLPQFFIYRRPIAWTALVAALIWGVCSYHAMPRRQRPLISSNRAAVLTEYPGASAEEVEQAVTRKIETAIAQHPGVEEVTSLSREGFSIVHVRLFDQRTDAGAVWQALRNRLAAIEDLPTIGGNPLRPQLDAGFGEAATVTLTISGPAASGLEIDPQTPSTQPAPSTAASTRGSQEFRPAAAARYSYRELRQFAGRIEARLRQSPAIGAIEQIGVQKEVVYLDCSAVRLKAIGMTLQEISSILDARAMRLPGGSIELPKLNVTVPPAGGFQSERDIGQTIVRSSPRGHPLYLRDIADIARGYEDPPAIMNFRTVKVRPTTAPGDAALQTCRAITLAIHPNHHGDVEGVGHQIDQALNDLKGLLPDDLRIELTGNEPRQVRERTGNLEQALLAGFAIIIVIVALLMGWRTALLAAISIPVTVAMTIGLCHLLGVGLQPVPIAALFIALGLLVDDPIVISNAMKRSRASGGRCNISAWQGMHSLARAVVFATITCLVLFLPLLLVTGETGQFIRSVPIVVAAALLSSRLVSITILPMLGGRLFKERTGPEAQRAAEQALWLTRAGRALAPWALRWRWLVLAACAALPATALLILPLIGTRLFPQDLHGAFAVSLTLPEGSGIRQTRDQASKLIETIDQIAGRQINSYTTFVGGPGPLLRAGNISEQCADNFAQVIAHTVAEQSTPQVVAKLKQELPSQVAGARVTIEQFETGPHIGLPVQVRLYGSQIMPLRQLAADVKAMMRQIPGTRNIHDDWDEQRFNAMLDIDTTRAHGAGIREQDLAATIRAAMDETPVAQIREGGRLIPVMMRLRADERHSIEDLLDLNIPTWRADATIPLRNIAQLSPGLVTPALRRRNHERCLTVLCDTAGGVLPDEVVHRLQGKLAAATASWPPGYRFEFGGQHEANARSFSAIAPVLVLSLAAVYLALIFWFNSIAKPLIVLAAVLFGIGGGMIGLLVFDQPFGITALLGAASLAAVIVSHAIVFFHFMDDMRKTGHPFREALAEAGLMRCRPVFATALATAGGLVPLAIAGGPFWQPMASVQIIGVPAAAIVTLIFVPALYAIFVQDLRIVRWDRVIDGPPAPAGAAEATPLAERTVYTPIAIAPPSFVVPPPSILFDSHLTAASPAATEPAGPAPRPLPPLALKEQDPDIARLSAARRAAG